MCKKICNELKLNIAKYVIQFVKIMTERNSDLPEFNIEIMNLIKAFDFYLGYFGKRHKLDNRANFAAASEKVKTTGIKIIDKNSIKRLELQNKIKELQKQIDELQKQINAIDEAFDEMEDVLN